MACISMPTAMIGSSVLGAGASLFGGMTQANAAQNAQNMQWNMFQQIQGNLSPFMNEGKSALPMLSNLLGLGPQGQGGIQSALAQTPGYQFALNQGLKATQNGFAAQGLGSSGAAMKGGANYAEGLASTTYQQQLANYMNLANMGGSAAGALGQFGMGAATNAGNAAMGGAAALAGGVSGAAGAFGQGLMGNAMMGMYGGPGQGTGASGNDYAGMADQAWGSIQSQYGGDISNLFAPYNVENMSFSGVGGL